MESQDDEPTQPNSGALSPKSSAMLWGHASQPVKPSIFIRCSSWSRASSGDIVMVVAYSDSWAQTKECTGDIRPLLPLVTLSWFLDSYIFSAIHNYLLNERNPEHRWLSSAFVERLLPSLKSLSSSVMWNPCESWLRPWLTRGLHQYKNTDAPVPSKKSFGYFTLMEWETYFSFFSAGNTVHPMFHDTLWSTPFSSGTIFTHVSPYQHL